MPTYMIGFTITLLALAAAGLFFDRPWPYTIQEVLIHYGPGLRDVLHYRSIDGIIWTLEIEIKYYILCAIFLLLFQRQSTFLFVIPATLFVGELALSRFMPVWAVELSALHAAITPFLFSAQYIVYMIAGTALHFVFVGRMSGKMGYLLAMALLLGFLLMWALCPRLVPIDLAWSYAFALAVFVAALRFQPRALSNPAIRLLASISYPLYVVHGVLGYVVLRILMDLGVDVGQSIAVTCLIVFPLAWTIHQFVEQPGQAVARILDAPTSQPG